MSGSIPPSLGNCSNFVQLDISTNELSGSIYQEILSLSSTAVFFNLSHNGLTGFLKHEVGNMRNLVVFDVSSNRLSGFLPSSLSKCLSLEWLHLDRNSFEGEIPPSWTELRGLCALDLLSNNLSGPIPSFLGDLHLENLNMSFNALHGKVPTQGVFRNASAISIEGNNDLCGDNIVGVKLPPCQSPNSKADNKLSVLLKVVIPIVVVIAFFTLLLCFFIFLHRLRASSKTKATLPSFINPCFRVSYADLLKATNGFSEANLIGLGSYGSIYKGTLHEGETVVAVKVLNLQCKGASKSFMSKCVALKSIRHRNVLKIWSACSSADFQDNEFKALVYEFMPNGSLENWFYGDGNKVESKNLKLIQRLNIAINIAFALKHLHCGCDNTFIHGDLKPRNVLLDDEMTAKIVDFGLAKVISGEHQNNSIAVKGTIGYVAPEYGMGGMVSAHADIYSYGILVLEISTSRKATDDAFGDKLNLYTFVKNALADQVLEVVDPRILSEHNTPSRMKNCMASILKIGVLCSVESPKDQMKIGDVITELQKIKNVYVEIWCFVFSGFYIHVVF